MVDKVSGHYGEEYFAWQEPMGEFGAWANLTKFDRYIAETNEILDFGCGGGYLLKNIKCRKRVGVEINPHAAEKARANGVEVYASAQDVPDDYVDLIISDNALEHAPHPLQALQVLYSKLRPGGKIVIVVPCESISNAYRPDDVNRHLYSWSPMCLGNLLEEAGFALVESKAYIHKWPPKYRIIAKIGGRPLFELACRIYGRMERSWFQVRAIAVKQSP